VEKYGSGRQVTDDNIIRHMRIACWIPKSTNKYVMTPPTESEEIPYVRSFIFLRIVGLGYCRTYYEYGDLPKSTAILPYGR